MYVSLPNLNSDLLRVPPWEQNAQYMHVHVHMYIHMQYTTLARSALMKRFCALNCTVHAHVHLAAGVLQDLSLFVRTTLIHIPAIKAGVHNYSGSWIYFSKLLRLLCVYV